MVTGQIGETVEDEQGNLMWLVDFKLDFFNDIDKEDGTIKLVQDLNSEPLKKRRRLSHELEIQKQQAPVEIPVETIPKIAPPQLPQQQIHLLAPVSQPQAQPQPLPQPTMPPTNLTQPQARSGAKPNYTYTDLITLALKDKTALTVSGIYQWIT